MAKQLGRYEFVKGVGRGGQAIVYEARDPRAFGGHVPIPQTARVHSHFAVPRLRIPGGFPRIPGFPDSRDINRFFS